MSSRDSLLAALFAGVLGIGAGLLLASVFDSSQVVAASKPADFIGPPSSHEGASPSADPLTYAALPETDRMPVAATADVAPSPVSAAELQRTLETVVAPSVEDARGSGSIKGEVIDEAGAPIQGAVVIGDRLAADRARDPAAIGAGPPSDQSLEKCLRERAESWATSRGSRRRAVTGPDGKFELEGLAGESRYQLSAFVEGHVVEADGSAYSVAPGQEVTFRAQAVHVIPVQLVYEDGRPATEGLVGVERRDREVQYTWSPESPELRLTAGRVGVRGYSGATMSGRSRDGVASTHGSEQTSVDVVAQAGVPLQLVLKARSGISGRVTDNFASGGSRLIVRLLPVAAGAELDVSALAGSDRRQYPNGDRFHFLDLPAGSYAVGLSNWDEALLAHETVTVGEGVVEVDLIVPEPDPQAHLVLRAFGPTGNPLRDLDFGWQHERAGGSSMGGLQGRRGQDNAWWLRPKIAFFEPWPAETSYTLTVKHSELGEREVQLEEGQREVTLVFEEPVSIVVVVAGYVGSGYEGRLKVGLAPVVEGDADESWRGMRGYDRGRGDDQFSPDGVARIDGLSPGLWDVSLQVKTDRWNSRTVQSIKVQVTSGEKTVTMERPSLHELTVIASGLPSGSRLYLQPADGGGQGTGSRESSRAEVDADGRAVFKALAPGDYVIRANGQPKSVDVTVPCGDVYIDIKEPDSLRVAIGDMEGALYKAGLRAGDLIIGTNGKEFESLSRAWDFFAGEGDVSLMVLRDGQRLDFVMKCITMEAGWLEQLGGMVTPFSRQ